MKVVQIDASGWTKILDFLDALAVAVGAPESHGRSLDAFADSMIHHDDINALKAPYTIRIVNIGTLPLDLRSEVGSYAADLNRIAAPDRGSELEIFIKLVH